MTVKGAVSSYMNAALQEVVVGCKLFYTWGQFRDVMNHRIEPFTEVRKHGNN